MENIKKGYVSINDKCIGCGSCMLECPAEETTFSVYRDGRRSLAVNPANCITCGNCLNVCKHDSREYNDDTDDFLSALAGGEKISVIVSADFYSVYGNRAANILGYLRSLGVGKIYDAAFGVDLFVYFTVSELNKYKDDMSERPFILNFCPAVINYIQRYAPYASRYIIPVRSPALCTAAYVRRNLNDRSKLAYIGACVSAGTEFENYSSENTIDYNVTLHKLLERIGNKDLSDYHAETDLCSEGFGECVTVKNGLFDYLSSMFTEDMLIVSYNKLTDTLRSLILSLEIASEYHPFLVIPSVCEYGCAASAGGDIRSERDNRTYLTSIRKIYARAVKKKSTLFSYQDYYNMLKNQFSGLDPEDYTAHFRDKFIQLHTVPDNIINDIFNRMNMTSEEKRHTDCRSCGYRTCREMASAVAKGYARVDDCARYVNEEYKKQIFYDSLTGIYGQAGFYREVPHLLEANPEKKYVVCVGNINNLKTINDLYNYNIGSQVIVYVSRILNGIVRKIGVCARLGGDHFAMCFENNEDNIRRLMSLRFFDCEMLGITMPVTMRFGLCGANEISDPLRLVNSASFAMEKITDYSRNSFIWYNDTMRDEITLEATITSQMRSAMLGNEFVMYVQPQYSHSSGKLVGAEALCRWIRPDGSTVTPQIFIPIFEKNGFVRVLDRYMWDCAFSQVKKWLDAGIEPVPLSVNISRMSLIDDEIITEIGKLSKKYGIDHSYIHFEITESAYIADYANLIERIGKIRDMGFKIAMDDFGSGYSSLNTLKDIPFDILKLDMGFLRGNSSSSKSGIILGSIIRMAHSIELITIAEGVETVIQADFLRSLGCDIIQGYLFARPMPVEDFESLMQKENSSGNVAPETEKKDGNETVTGIFVRNNAIISLFENYVGPAAVLEFSGTYFGLVRVNNDMIRLLGFTNFTAMEFSRSFSAGIAQEDQIKLKDALTKALDGEKGAVCIFGYTRPDGTHICLKAKLWYLGLNGQIPVIYTIVDDVSDVVKDVTGKQE